MVAVYWVLPVRLAAGVNRAVLPLTLTVPEIAEPPLVGLSVKLEVFNVELVIASENVAEIEEFDATPRARFCGVVDVTVGGVVSGAAAVVKLQE